LGLEDEIKDKTVGDVHSMHGQMRNVCTVLIKNPEKKKLFDRTRHKFEDNIKMNFKEMCVRMWTGFIWYI
jgi:hypothetical protein